MLGDLPDRAKVRALLQQLPPPLRHLVRRSKYLEGPLRRAAQRLPLHRLPLLGLRSPRPEGLHWWVAEYVALGLGRRGDRIHPVYPAEKRRRSLPASAGGLPAIFSQSLEAEVPAATVCELHDVRFWGCDGGCIVAPDNRLIGDLSPDTWAPDRHRALARPWLPRLRKLPGVTAVLTTTGEQNYWHWMAETLPRYHVLAQAGFPPDRVDWFLSAGAGAAFQLETWAALGVPREKIVRVDAKSHFALERALIPSHRLATWNVPRWVVECLRALPVRSVEPPLRAERLYLSRARESHRRLSCEAALVPRLRERGFAIVDGGKLSIAEQKALFARARLVVAPHGAALTNLVFCPLGALVLDVMSGAWPGLFFWGLAEACGLRYGCMVDRLGAPGVVPDLRCDIELSVEEILVRVDEMLDLEAEGGCSPRVFQP